MNRKYEKLKIPAIAPLSPGAAPEQNPRYRAGSSGWLEEYSVIRCQREYWYWRYCWRDESGKIHHKHVLNCYVKAIAAAIAAGMTISYIRKMLQFRAIKG